MRKKGEDLPGSLLRTGHLLSSRVPTWNLATVGCDTSPDTHFVPAGRLDVPTPRARSALPGVPPDVSSGFHSLAHGDRLMKLFLKTTIPLACALLIATPALAQNYDEDFKRQTNKTIRLLDFVPIAGTAAVVSETEPNDDCGAPDPASIFVDDVAASIDVAGDEDWFVFDGVAGQCVTIATESRESSSTDTQLYIYDAAGCSDPLAFLAFNDDGGPGLFSLISDFEIPADGTYYVRVKHFSSSGTGAYTLLASEGACPQPPANNTCATAEPVACNSSVTGSTVLGTNDLEDLTGICVPFGADGPDVFYSVVVEPGEQIDALVDPVDWDPALWIVTNCTDENTCVAGADAGFFNDPESVSWTNEGDSPQTVFVIVDSFTASAFGDFTLTISCDAVVSGDEESFGSVKARF